MKNKNYRSVYSTDGSHKDICKVCSETPCECRAIEEVVPSQVIIKIRKETKGRGGKAVSVLFNFPNNPDYLTKLTKTLKNKCGTGGTYKDGQIEIQGDHRASLKQHLEALGFQVKLAGG